MIPDEEVAVTISHLGYIKRTKLTEYKSQGEGGVGSRGATTRDEDFLEDIFVARTMIICCFSQNKDVVSGYAYLKSEGAKASKGRAIQNMINIPSDDKVMAFINTKDLKDEDYIANNYVVMYQKRSSKEDFFRIVFTPKTKWY